MAHPSRTSLIIGGTGMLAAASNWLISESGLTVLVARHAVGFARANPSVRAINADWQDSRFETKLTSELRSAPAISAALLWIHDPAPVLHWLMPLLQDARIVLVLGSTDGDPPVPETGLSPVLLRLGSMPSAEGRRWLTHEEISAAAIASLGDGKSRIVGELRAVS